MIVCGTDFSDNAVAAAEVAAAFAKKLRVPLELVHVIDELGAEIEAGGPRDAIYDPRRAQLRAEAERLRDRHEIEVDPITVFGVIAAKLVEIAAIARAGVLIVGALGSERRARWLLGSVAQTARVPALVIRDGAAILAWARGDKPLRVLVVTGEPDEDAPDPIDRLHELVPPSARERDIETTFELVTHREPGLAIGQAAGRLGVDAICRGTHGRSSDPSGVARLVLGSQAQ